MKILLLLLLIFPLTACAPQVGAVSDSGGALPQVPDTQTITGRVTGISGNDVLLTLGEYSVRAAETSSEASAESAEASFGREAPAEGTRGSKPDGEGSGGAPSGAGTQNTAGTGGRTGEGTAAGAQQKQFYESGGSLSLRIPVGTPVVYGGLKVDFSQLRVDYIITVTSRADDESAVLSAEILAT